jgi:hypothetical protein
MRYRNDPRWIEARFKSECKRCKATIKKGEKLFYYPLDKSCYCSKEDCGGKESASFEAAAFDESMMSGSW